MRLSVCYPFLERNTSPVVAKSCSMLAEAPAASLDRSPDAGSGGSRGRRMAAMGYRPDRSIHIGACPFSSTLSKCRQRSRI
jgi:hypothetical protein